MDGLVHGKPWSTFRRLGVAAERIRVTQLEFLSGLVTTEKRNFDPREKTKGDITDTARRVLNKALLTQKNKTLLTFHHAFFLCQSFLLLHIVHELKRLARG